MADVVSVKTEIKTPKFMAIKWVYINGNGKDQSENNDGSKMQKMATVVGHKDDPQVKELMKALDDVWAAAKAANPKVLKQATQPKSMGYKFLKYKETDEETGEVAFQFKSNSFYKDGRSVTIPVYNAAGQKVDLGDAIIGNGSTGVIHGVADVYAFKGAYGITLYLKGIQLKKFVKAEFGSIDAEDFTSEDDDEESFIGLEGSEANTPDL
ncbi:MAG: hypothetical protein AB7D38_12100 [Sulfurimonas sp.]|uniref:hypothetical protein n=1 Tax=Sulfurimonas sp. TaxID=2022749 RepID=UPI003D106DFE